MKKKNVLQLPDRYNIRSFEKNAWEYVEENKIGGTGKTKRLGDSPIGWLDQRSI
jgi:hypothetical protein